METLKLILSKLRQIKNIFIYGVILFLVVVIYFKTNRIYNLEAQLAEKPQIEYSYIETTDTIRDTIPIPVEIIKWRDSVIYNTVYKPIDLSHSDSTAIAQAYNDLYNNFSDIKRYDNVIKDDSIAFIRLKENVQYNAILDRELIFKDRTPIITNTVTKETRTISLVGGLSANYRGVNIAGGVVTDKNIVIVAGYDPFNKTAIGEAYFPIFNFKFKK